MSLGLRQRLRGLFICIAMQIVSQIKTHILVKGNYARSINKACGLPRQLWQYFDSRFLRTKSEINTENELSKSNIES